MAKGEKKVKLSKEELKAKKAEMKKAGFGMIGEFKKFVMRGNVLDMAIGVIVGGAFSKIVTSLVNDIIMPLIGSLVGTVNFTDLKANIGDTVIPYGSFIQKINNDYDMSKSQILKVDSFDDMLEIRDTLQAPILMLENKDKYGVFFIIPTAYNVLYTYALRVDDIKVDMINDVIDNHEVKNKKRDIEYNNEYITKQLNMINDNPLRKENIIDGTQDSSEDLYSQIEKTQEFRLNLSGEDINELFKELENTDVADVKKKTKKKSTTKEKVVKEEPVKKVAVKKVEPKEEKTSKTSTTKAKEATKEETKTVAKAKTTTKTKTSSKAKKEKEPVAEEKPKSTRKKRRSKKNK